MKVAVIGYGSEGRSAVAYWDQVGNQVTICDAKSDLAASSQMPDHMQFQLGDDYLQNLTQFDLIVRSPGVRPADIFRANPDLNHSKVTSVTNEFLAQCPAKVIGVTGTKGKGTTATLIAQMLEAAGHKAWLGGNIGTPALDFLDRVQPEDWVVLELSSFQLIDARRSPHVAVHLMAAPDHLDWHPDMGEYLAAKQAVFKFQQPGDRAIFNACNLYSLRAGLGAPADQVAFNSRQAGWVDGDQVKMGDRAICATNQIALPGRHNWDNVCAALTAVWPIVAQVQPIAQAISQFKGLPHRLESVDVVNQVTYINDSYSSNPAPTIAALEAFTQPKVVILGGLDRHLDYAGLARQVADSGVRRALLIGEIAPQLQGALDKVKFTHYIRVDGDMKQIVATAATAARAGDVVLLSPGAASFDMFDNFQQRGELFRQAVSELGRGVVA